MLNLVSSLDINMSIIKIFIGIAIFCLPLLIYKIFNNGVYDSFKEWICEEAFGCVISFILIIFAAVILILGSCILINNIKTIHQNKITEPAIYEKMVICSETYRDALEHSTDIINTELYLNIVDYNEQLAIIKSKSKMPNYDFNFSGACNWDALDYIDLIEE